MYITEYSLLVYNITAQMQLPSVPAFCKEPDFELGSIIDLMSIFVDERACKGP